MIRTLSSPGILAFCVSFASIWADDKPAPDIRVFADIDHTGSLVGPLDPGKPGRKGFCITVPVSASIADQELIRVDAARSDEIGERLARVRIEGLPEAATVRLVCKGIEANRVLALRRTDAGWEMVKPKSDAIFSLPATKNGLVVGVAVVLPKPDGDVEKTVWPTAFIMEIDTEQPESAKVHIPCRVAPFLIPSSLDPANEVLIVNHRAASESVKAMEALASTCDFKLIVHDAQGRTDQWMQDTIEPGRYAYPTPKGPRQLPAALTGIRKEFGRAAAALDEQISARLQEHGVLTVAPGVPRKNTRWIDWYGNLETSPPHVDRQGRRFPYGRVLTGKQGERSMHPSVMKFLESQGMQWPPIVVDTSWLGIGHVDEVVNFAPAKNKAGFRVLVPSPKAAKAVLESAMNQGLGDVEVFANSRSKTTVKKLYEDVAGSKENIEIDETIARIQKQLMTELSIDEADFVMLPVLFRRGGAVIPNAVNSVIVNGHMLVPSPRGPQQNGKDFFEAAIVAAMATCDVKVSFVEAWSAYHSSGGELHCGTNTIRRLRDPDWWKYVDATRNER